MFSLCTKKHPERINREKGRALFIKNVHRLLKEDKDRLIRNIKLCHAHPEDHGDGYEVTRLFSYMYEAFYDIQTTEHYDAIRDVKSKEFLTHQAALYIHSLSAADLDKFLTEATTETPAPTPKRHRFLNKVLTLFTRGDDKTK